MDSLSKDFLVDKKTNTAHHIKTYRNDYGLIPIISTQTGNGLLRYIQSLHQYQKNQEANQKEKVAIIQDVLMNTNKYYYLKNSTP